MLSFAILSLFLCFVLGYVINVLFIASNRFSVKYLRFPVDFQDRQEYDAFSGNLLANNKKYCDENGIALDRQLGALLYDFIMIGTREEIAYRFFIETILLPWIYPPFAVFSIARAAITSLLFAARHLHNNYSREGLTAQFLHTVWLGMICSFTQQYIGFIGAILVHAGYNLYAWQYMYNQKFSDVPKTLQSLHSVDFTHPPRIISLFTAFIDDLFSPFVLTIQLVKKVWNFSFRTSAQDPTL